MLNRSRTGTAKGKQKAWRLANAKATAKGFNRNNPEHRGHFTSKREVRAGGRFILHDKIPHALLVSLLVRAGVMVAP